MWKEAKLFTKYHATIVTFVTLGKLQNKLNLELKNTERTSHIINLHSSTNILLRNTTTWIGPKILIHENFLKPAVVSTSTVSTDHHITHNIFNNYTQHSRKFFPMGYHCWNVFSNFSIIFMILIKLKITVTYYD